MPIFRIDELNDKLFFGDEEIFAEDCEVFDLEAARFRNILLSEIPTGIKVRLCNKMIGSRDLISREPHAVFEKSSKLGIIAHLSNPILPQVEDLTGLVLQDFFRVSLDTGENSLNPLKKAGRIVNIERNIFDEIAYLDVTITLFDQTLGEAEAFLYQIQSRVLNAYEPPNLFICYASEDENFVNKIVSELDRHAMFAWYDKREIFVGDSIIEKINQALQRSDYLIAILSPRSVIKQWFKREINSSLIRQINRKCITILPVLLEPCEIPSLLSDFKYADFSRSFSQGFSDLLQAIRC